MGLAFPGRAALHHTGPRAVVRGVRRCHRGAWPQAPLLAAPVGAAPLPPLCAWPVPAHLASWASLAPSPDRRKASWLCPQGSQPPWVPACAPTWCLSAVKVEALRGLDAGSGGTALSRAPASCPSSQRAALPTTEERGGFQPGGTCVCVGVGVGVWGGGPTPNTALSSALVKTPSLASGRCWIKIS